MTTLFLHIRFYSSVHFLHVTELWVKPEQNSFKQSPNELMIYRKVSIYDVCPIEDPTLFGEQTLVILDWFTILKPQSLKH